MQNVINRIFIISMLATFTVGCVENDYSDISQTSEYQSLIGKNFTLMENVWATGITTDQNYKGEASHIVLVPEPGFEGPEVVFRNLIEKGDQISVTKVLLRKSLLKNSIYYELSFNSGKRFDIPVLVKMTETIDTSSYGLNSDVYMISK
jgi:hypothetical protein|tara:strand:- start:5733 stop:6179 length:447 start_codon:yes stop_codon:yes gene_type:complete